MHTAKKLRQPSLRNVATLVRSNLRSSLRAANARAKANANGGDWSTTDDDEDTAAKAGGLGANTFAGVAQQVVSSKRAARGFLSMWPRGSGGGAALVYRGIHMEKKKLDLATVAAEYKEMKRRQFYQELIVYLVFLGVFFSLLAWLPVQASFQQNDVVGALTCREEGVCDVHSFGDLYDFAEDVQGRVCAPDADDSRGAAQWTRVGGVRFRQVRVQQQQCRVYGDWVADCFPFYSAEVQDTAPLLGAASNRTYEWHDGLGRLSPHLYKSSLWPSWPFASSSSGASPAHDYGTGGLAVDLCNASLDDLRADAWLSPASRAVSVEFTLLNPVTRVFTLGLHVFTLHPSGHLEHFAHSSHLRVVGLERTELAGDASEDSLFRTNFWVPDPRLLLWAALLIFFITYCIGEAGEMSCMGARTYLGSDMWNLFELTHLTVLAGLLIWSVRYYTASWAFAAHVDEVVRTGESGDHSSVQTLLSTFQQLADLASVGSAFSLLKVFKFLRMNSTLNLLWKVLGMAMSDLMGFLVIFNLIFLGYSAMGSYAFGFALEEFSTIGRSYGTCFQMLAGEMDYPRLRQANPRLAPVFIGSFVVLVFQIVVNMFVAILSEYYEVAKNGAEGGEQDVEYDVLARLRTYMEAVSPTVVMARKNDVIRLVPRQTVRLISTNLVDQEETRQRAKKLFRGAVWRVVALLRFGMKFDRRIQFGERKGPHGGAAHGGSAGNEKNSVTHIRLSENFDHKTIKDMIPIGITVRLEGDSLLGDGLALKVVHHNSLSVECVVLGTNDSNDDKAAGEALGNRAVFGPPRTLSSLGSFGDSDAESTASGMFEPRERVLELIGGEKLRIPWQHLVIHVGRTLFKELKVGLLQATKLWSVSKAHLVDDYHLGLLFDSVRADGRESLRFDEISRMLDLYLRKDKRRALCSQNEVRQEALYVMYRFRRCLIDMPSREKEGHNYRPKPVDTSMIDLGPLLHLGDMLARNCHDMWALERLKQGWQYGPTRDDARKRHPNLVPYKLLSVEEQAFDYRSSLETLKTIVFMNYTIVRSHTSGSTVSGGGTGGGSTRSFSRSASTISDDLVSAPTSANTGSNSSLVSGNGDNTHDSDDDNTLASLGAKTPLLSASKPMPSLLREAMSFRRSSLMDDSPYYTTYGEGGVEVYRPLPIDTTHVELPPRLLRLVDLLAENAHEVWSKGRMDEGWTYGPARDDPAKKHPCLVPYVFLTDDEKEYDINIAKETLKTLLAMKFTIVDRSSGRI